MHFVMTKFTLILKMTKNDKNLERKFRILSVN